MSIQILDEDTINKIAAGEVIERPMAVVKELVENAIDAKANSVTIEIKDGGKSLIRVTDNGSGISEEDIKLAFVSHATSKIKYIDDLLSVSTLGFRGEALASIAAVSQLEMLTKTKSSFNGSRYVIEGGSEKKLEQAGCPDGTTFIVHNLFYNTPARLKFLKTPQTEAGYISSAVEHMALSHPGISFRFINQNQPRLHTSGNGNIKDVIYNIYGRDIASNLIEINAIKESCTIKGFIGKPVISRGNRNYINYFINGRYIKNNIINHAIEEAYSSYMMQHKYPFTVLHFQVDPEIMDVNVHPQKMEVRFTNEKELYKDIYDTLTEALKHRELIPDITFEEKRKKKETEKKLPEKKARENIKSKEQDIPDTTIQLPERKKPGDVTLRYPAQEEINRLFGIKNIDKSSDITEEPVITNIIENKPAREPDTEAAGNTPVLLRENAAYKAHNIKQETLFETNVMSPQAEKDIKIIGQVFATYWILQYGDNMFIIDQHAAHEKVLYERFIKQIEQNKPLTQMVNPPVVISLSMFGQQVLEENIQVFEKLGYCIESFGGNEYILNGVPAQLPDIATQELFIEIIDGLASNKNDTTPGTLLERVATMSCKAAVKGGSRLDERQAQELLKELMQLENPYNCPHGRPVMVKITQRELEKKFKRII